MTALNEWDRADRYDDGRTRYDDADVTPDPPAWPRNLSPAEQHARRLRIDDPWDDRLVGGRCCECGGQSQHAETCTAVGGTGHVPPAPMTDRTRRRMFALLGEYGVTDAARQRAGMGRILGRPVTSRSSLTEDDALAVIRDLESRLPERHGGAA